MKHRWKFAGVVYGHANNRAKWQCLRCGLICETMFLIKPRTGGDVYEAEDGYFYPIEDDCAQRTVKNVMDS